MFTKVTLVACLLGLARASGIGAAHGLGAGGLSPGLAYGNLGYSGAGLGYDAGLGYGAFGQGTGYNDHGIGPGYGSGFYGSALGNGLGFGGNSGLGLGQRNLGGPGAYEINVSGVAGRPGGLVSEYQYSISHPPTVNGYGANGAYGAGYSGYGNGVYGRGGYGNGAYGNGAYGNGAYGYGGYGNPVAGW